MTVLGDRVRKLRREELALTQRELAALLDIDAVNLSRWERGVSEPSLRYVRLLAEVSGKPVSWFFNEDDKFGGPGALTGESGSAAHTSGDGTGAAVRAVPLPEPAPADSPREGRP